MKINNEFDFSSINFRDFYLKGLAVSGTCTQCKMKYHQPTDNLFPCDVQSDGSCNLNFGCQNCEEPVSKKIKLNFSMTEITS